MGLFGLSNGDALSFVLGGPGGYATYNALKPGSSPDMPYQPNMIAPDFGPNKMFSNYTNWQNTKRNQMLADFYGGKVYRGNGKLPQEPNFDGWIGDMKNLDDGGSFLDPFEDSATTPDGVVDKTLDWMQDKRGVKPNRTSVAMTGNKPANQWMNTQRQVINSADRNFEGDLSDYMKERGIAGDGNVRGASTEQAKDFDLMRKQIQSRAQQIKMNTLGQLFGEVGDAGPQSAQMVGQIGQVGDMFNQQSQQQYNALLQKFQYDQQNQQPGIGQRLGGLAGQLLPFMLMGGGAPPVKPTSGYSTYV